MKAVCDRYDRLPPSFVIKDGIELHEPLPHAKGQFWDVYKARYNGRFVAVKAMKDVRPQCATSEEMDESKKVRLVTLLLL